MSGKLLFEEIEFDVEKEVWNSYELEDGNYRVTVRMRSILTKIVKPRIMHPDPLPLVGIPKELQAQGQGHRQEMQMSFQNIVVVSNCPPELMGPPSPPIPPSDLNQLSTEEIGFTAFSEDWNIYTLSPSGQKIKVKLVVSSISKPKGAYDQFGYPLYIVQSTNAIAPVLPKLKK